MSTFIELFHNFTSPEWIVAHGGLYIVMFIVFAETGLFVGFFLPGDTLLFIAGMIVANSVVHTEPSFVTLLYWVLLIALSGIVGNYVGYWFGRKSGDYLLKRKDTWLFKKKYLLKAKAFYERKGGSAIIMARFLPVVRTFAPIVAGMVKMDAKKFSFYNIVGSFAWVGSIVTAGYLLGENAWVKGNLEIIIIGIVVITTAPLIIKALMGKKDKLNVIPLPVIDEEEIKSKKKH